MRAIEGSSPSTSALKEGYTMSIFIVMAVVRAMYSDDPDERLWGWVMFAISWVVVIVGVIVLWCAGG